MLEIGTSAKNHSFMQKQLKISNFGHWMSKGYFCKHTSNCILSTKIHVIFKLPPCDIFVFASDPGPTQIRRRKKNNCTVLHQTTATSTLRLCDGKERCRINPTSYITQRITFECQLSIVHSARSTPGQRTIEYTRGG